MFTGIIRHLGTVKKITSGGGVVMLEIVAPNISAKIGDSIAINGVCLTVEHIQKRVFSFVAVSETLRRTSLGKLKKGSRVNLETSLRLKDGLDGHLVLGHVDAVGKISRILRSSRNFDIFVQFPKILTPFIVEKGSITIDGVSLTVSKVRGTTLSATIVPHTRETTTIGGYSKGTVVNLEVDVIARYVYNMSR